MTSNLALHRTEPNKIFAVSGGENEGVAYQCGGEDKGVAYAQVHLGFPNGGMALLEATRQPESDAAYNSFSVQGRVRQSIAKTRAYQVRGVPTMIVNGKYLVDGTMAGGNVAMLQVVDFLIDLERQNQTSDLSTE